MLLSLRQALPEDALQLGGWFRTREEVWDWTGPAPWPLSRAWLQAELTGRREGYFALTAGERLVGWFGLRLHHDRAHLVRVALDPAYRGCGYSAQLLEAACFAAAARDHTFLTLKVYAENTAAVRAYERADFAYIREERDEGRGGALVWWMGRNLEDFALA